MIAKYLSRVFMIGRFSSKIPVDPVSHTPINRPPEELASLRTKMIHNGWRVPDATHQKSKLTHLSNGEEQIHKIPVIKVNVNVVRCIGGTELGAGHSVQYIQVNTKFPGEPIACKYCGLRYALAQHDEHVSSEFHKGEEHNDHHHHEHTAGDEGYDQSHLKKHHSTEPNKRLIQ